MTWQDFVLAGLQVAFIIALFPSLASDDKPHPKTSAMTGIALLVMAFTFATLRLYWAAATAFICGASWLVLLYQHYKHRAINEYQESLRETLKGDLTLVEHAGSLLMEEIRDGVRSLDQKLSLCLLDEAEEIRKRLSTLIDRARNHTGG